MVVEATPKEVEQVHGKHFEFRQDQLTSAITSLIERLPSEGTRQDTKYKEELMHNMLAFAQNVVYQSP